MKIRYPTAVCGSPDGRAAGTKLTDAEDQQQGPFLIFENPTGIAATYNTAGKIDRDNPFFQKLGTNGRSCDTCHQASDGWTVIPPHIRDRFDATKGTDPIFRLVDGANSPNADVSTVAARRDAYSMLLTKGLIRVGIGIPDNAEFELVGVDDPYGYASARELSLFRRPLPTTNLKFLSTVMCGRPRDIQGSRIDRLHFRHNDLLRVDSIRSRRSVERRHGRTRPGRATALAGAARSDRAVRDGAVHRAGVRFEGDVSGLRREPVAARCTWQSSRSISASTTSFPATTRRQRLSIRSCSPCTTPGPACQESTATSSASSKRARPWRVASCCSTPSRSRSRTSKG